MKVLLDTNVVLDVLQNRSPWCTYGQEIFLVVANKQIIGCITAKEATDIFFFSRRQFKGQEDVDKKARTVLSKLFSIFEVLDTLAIDCQEAVVYDNNDYEDAVMIKTAMRTGVDCIVSRDKQHYTSSPIPVYQPDEFVQKMKEGLTVPDEEIKTTANTIMEQYNETFKELAKGSDSQLNS